MTDRHVEPCALGQQRQEESETCGAWKRPGWEPEVFWFLCVGCGYTIPGSLCSMRERAFLASNRGRCDGCEATA